MTLSKLVSNTSILSSAFYRVKELNRGLFQETQACQKTDESQEEWKIILSEQKEQIAKLQEQLNQLVTVKETKDDHPAKENIPQTIDDRCVD